MTNFQTIALDNLAFVTGGNDKTDVTWDPSRENYSQPTDLDGLRFPQGLPRPTTCVGSLDQGRLRPAACIGGMQPAPYSK